MHVRLLRRLPPDRSGGASDSWEYSLQTVALTIGRASSADVQILDPAVALHHAVIRPLGGRLRIKAMTPSPISVNGKRRWQATLAEGDVISIGATALHIRQLQRGAAVVLEIEEPAAAVDGEPAARHALTLRDTRLSAHAWSWALVLSLAAVFLVAPLSASLYRPVRHALRSSPLTPSDGLWQPGALHSSHQFIGADCNACHTTPFRRVSNAQCTSCHKGVQHHIDVRTADRSLFQERRCGQCHFEHNQPSLLVRRDSRLCTECHQQLRRLKPDTELTDVSDFGTDHPDFRLTFLERRGSVRSSVWQPVRAAHLAGAMHEEHSGLTFSHAVHMDPTGIKTAQGYEVLSCGSCHQPQSSGRQMLPIRMETHCARCHSLRFDERDPATVVPHGDLAKVFETLQAHFIRAYLHGAPATSDRSVQPRRPGREAQIMAREEQERARDWSDRQSLLIARELLEERVCTECHRVSRVSGATGFAQWRVEPVRITSNWMPRARFNHVSHGTTACAKCHASAATSKSSSEVLMPSISVCRECHRGGADRSRLASDCGMCHAFHLPGRGLFDADPRQSAARSSHEAQ